MKLNPEIGDFYITNNKRILQVVSLSDKRFLCQIQNWHTGFDVFEFYYTGCIAMNWWDRASYQIKNQITKEKNPEYFL